MKTAFNAWLDRQLHALGYIKTATLNDQLQYARSVAKRLDEHREVVEAIENNTDFFEHHPWHANHLAIQDDYLMRLFKLVHGHFPDAPEQEAMAFEREYVRARPAILGQCQLPEVRSEGKP